MPDAYDERWSSRLESPTRRRIKREVYGDEHPAEADPRSFLTRSELRRIVAELGIGPGDTFADLGCGPGGPGLWVANETRAGLVGIDASEPALAQARERAASLGLSGRATFVLADVSETGLEDASLAGAMSVDVLWAVSDKKAALQEAARILEPGARFVFTNWDRELSPPGYPPPLGDHRPLLATAGFELDAYETQEGAEDLRRAYYERIVAAERELTEELGEDGVRRQMFEAKGTLGLADGIDYLAHSRRIFVVARKVP